ncbi:uncharacterized protein LOC143069310 isoform X2 [Mytilus galloprovincialis]|uniref:uncharacterized protein LOC143069310 isoform X2 n=1 Tax=Mytilus galloprovincialis TaxID=29158 RepID=UPI003F7CB9F7
MRTVALISGGKDSCYNMMQCVIEGHDIIALANLKPREKDELDSYMYQTVGHHAIHLYADAIGLPLYRHTIEGSSTAIKMDYETTVGDEVEDLYTLLKKIKDELQIEAVSVGAILSDYQRVRVEHVCQRLGLTSLAYLWRRDQSELLKEMIDSGVSAILIKVASMGLNPKTHLGRNLKELYPQLIQMNKEFQLNVCGEGGEYETFTVDCPLFNKFIVIDTSEEVIHSNDAFAPVSYLNLQSVHVEDKHFDMKKRLTSRLDHYPMKRSSDIHKEIFSENEPLIHESEICELDTPYKCPESTDLIKLQVKQREKDIWITGVTVKRERGKTTEEMTCLAMNKLKECMLERTGNWSLSDLCMINLYISDMNDFGAINDIYKKYFGLNPPARVCVQVPLPENIVLQLECYGSCNEDKHTMHVQSISHWAPANIGPYSQAVKVDKRMYIAGQIAMVPSTLNIISGGIRAESRLCLRHIHRILEAMPGSTSLKNISIAICYVSQRDYISIVKKEMKYAGHTFLNHNHSSFSIENNTMPSMIEFVVVPRLPRNAKVEWKVYSDITDILSIENTIFHLSDQLKSTGKYKVTNSSLSCIVKVDRSGNQFERPDLSRAVKCFYQCYEKIVQSSEVEWKSLPALSIFYSVLSSFSYDHLIKELSCQLNKDIIFTIVPVIEFSSETTLLVGCH